jgi:cobalt/nickel transport system ATP-binding protein
MKQPLIHCHDVSFSYSSERQVLCGMNFSLYSGERIGLIGPNGAGKTTFLHLLVGLLKPVTGSIWAFGKERQTEQDFYDVRVRAGLVFQDSDDQLFCPTVLEDVAFGLLNLGKSPQEAKELSLKTLHSLGLEGFEERITYKLSYGEKRLVALATVLSMQPEVLLLDEPTNGLDDKAKQRIADLLLTLPQAMVIISHETDFIHMLTTRTVQFVPDGTFL